MNQEALNKALIKAIMFYLLGLTGLLWFYNHDGFYQFPPDLSDIRYPNPYAIPIYTLAIVSMFFVVKFLFNRDVENSVRHLKTQWVHGEIYEAQLDMREKRFESASRHLVKALHMDENNSKALYRHTQLMLLRDRAEFALESAQKLASVAGKDARAWNLLALVCLRLNMPHDALDAARTAVKLNPRNGTSLNVMGVALAELGAYVDAKEYFDEAVLRRSDGFAYNNRGAVLKRLGDFSSAASNFSLARIFNPNDLIPAANEAISLKNYPAAHRYLKRYKPGVTTVCRRQ